MNEAPLIDADLTVSHDFPTPCGSLWHPEYGDGDAEWIVWQAVCCDKRPEFGFCCDPCLQAILNYPGAARCRDCNASHRPARRSVRRVEPLGRRS